MSAADSHEILGVAPDASAAEIKRAYRRLAMRWHPDRNSDPRAHDQFRRVREAFEHLSRRDEERDEPITEDSPASEPSRPRRPKGEDRHMEMAVDLIDAARGCIVTVTIDSRSPCTDCDGSGQRSYGRTTMCGNCHGSGRIRGKKGLETCPDCRGKGFFSDNRCPSCAGRGWHPAERQLAVQIPPAMLHGEEIRVAGQGASAPENGDPGDLYLSIRIKPHALFLLDGRDVHVNVPVSVFRLLAGGSIAVPTLSGVMDVHLPEGGHKTQLRVPEAGYPGRGARPAGDLLVHFEPQHPQFLSQEQKAMLEMAEQILLRSVGEQSPALAQWHKTLDTLR